MNPFISRRRFLAALGVVALLLVAVSLGLRKSKSYERDEPGSGLLFFIESELGLNKGDPHRLQLRRDVSGLHQMTEFVLLLNENEIVIESDPRTHAMSRESLSAADFFPSLARMVGLDVSDEGDLVAPVKYQYLRLPAEMLVILDGCDGKADVSADEVLRLVDAKESYAIYLARFMYDPTNGVQSSGDLIARIPLGEVRYDVMREKLDQQYTPHSD